jgi:hypothetical protein
MDATRRFLARANNPWIFNLFLLIRLPAAYVSGVRLRSVTVSEAVATVPYRWLSQNPFRSIYFACQAMAAELSTGILAMAHLQGRQPAVSMLVVGLESEFHKKGVSLVRFTCRDGEAMRMAVERAVATGEPQTLTATSVGEDADGRPISTFRITWSFKARPAGAAG